MRSFVEQIESFRAFVGRELARIDFMCTVSLEEWKEIRGSL